MSLNIDTEYVSRILLADGEWYDVLRTEGKSNFTIDTYEFEEWNDDEIESTPVWRSGLAGFRAKVRTHDGITRTLVGSMAHVLAIEEWAE